MFDTPCYKKNLNSIKEHHPGLIQLIGSKQEVVNGEPRIEKSRKGSPTLSVLTEDGQRIYVHSSYDPVEEAEKIVMGCRIKKSDNTVFLLGFGLGYLSLCLVDKLDATQNLFIVEPSIEIFGYGLGYLDLTPLFTRPQTFFILGSHYFEELKKQTPEMGHKTTHVTLSSSLRLTPDLMNAISLLENKEFSALRERLDYPKFVSASPKVLFFEGGFHIEKEFQSALNDLDIKWRSIPVKSGREVGNNDFMSLLFKKLTEFRPDFIVTINQMGFDQEGKLADILTHYEIPFVSWFVDNPINLLSNCGKNASEYGLYLIWDDFYIEPMKKLGFKRVVCIPYATDPTIFFPSKEINKKYNISFVGNSLTDIIRNRLHEIEDQPFLIDAYRKLTQEYDDRGRSSSDAVEMIKEEIGRESVSSQNLISLEVAIISKWTQKRRLRMLLALKDFSPCVFGDDGWKELLPSEFQILPSLDYRRELSAVYRATTINLNISNLQLRNSVNQRIFDVCASGSFLLTDQRVSVERFLKSGREIETYETERELREKAEFYLDHPKEREHIEKRGCKTIFARNTYRHRIEEILKLLKQSFMTR